MFDIEGKVVKGKKRGKELGFPTANVYIKKKLDEGIYISYINVEGKRLPSLTFIGAAVTFGETKIKSETYILNFDKNIYDKIVKIETVKKIRENTKFSSREELIIQMEKDREEAEDYFKKNNV